ncbi:hypothetical protein QAD02_003012 [Eretmocerus hayati]|uniref:Uncharacterized protein n=1 Tax=Eretmocerus hayati TaxID=131215 RepID=A0ACC2NKM8_9HYME|nr:hypothetical protein QAD02_003012 [Eretmocerus hayati]
MLYIDDADSSESSHSGSEVETTSFSAESDGFHKPKITIRNRLFQFSETLAQFIPKMATVEELKKQLEESLLRERKLALEKENNDSEVKKLKERLAQFEIFEDTTSINEEQLKREIASISHSRHVEFSQRVKDVREFDGTTDVEAFLEQCKRINDQLHTDAEKYEFIYKVMATKLKGEAIAVANRMPDKSPKHFKEATRLAFGKTESDYNQLTGEKNSMRQGYNERIENFIKRYGEIDKRVQRSIDQVDSKYNGVYRGIEEEQRIQQFLGALKPTIKSLVVAAQPATLNDAYFRAIQEEKIYNEDEIIRPQQRGRRDGKTLQASRYSGAYGRNMLAERSALKD